VVPHGAWAPVRARAHAGCPHKHKKRPHDCAQMLAAIVTGAPAAVGSRQPASGDETDRTGGAQRSQASAPYVAAGWWHGAAAVAAEATAAVATVVAVAYISYGNIAHTTRSARASGQGRAKCSSAEHVPVTMTRPPREGRTRRPNGRRRGSEAMPRPPGLMWNAGLSRQLFPAEI